MLIRDDRNCRLRCANNDDIVGYSDGIVSCEDIGSGARSNHAQSDFANVSVYLAGK